MKNRQRLAGGAAAVAALAFTAFAHAANKFWDGGAGTNSWHDAANWSPDGVPGAKDDVILGSVTVVHGTGSTLVKSLSISGGTLVVVGGDLDALGAFSVSGAVLDYQGGSVSAEPLLINSTLSIGPSATAPFAAVAVGGSSLSGTLHAAQTLWVQGNSSFGGSTLTVAQNAVNAGTIRIESTGSSWSSQLSIPVGAEFVNQPSGTIVVNLGSGGPRAFAGGGDVRNEGVLSIQAGIGLAMDGAGRVFRNAGGSASIDGVLSMTNSTFLLEDGAISGTGTVFVSGGSLLLQGGSFAPTGAVVNAAIDIDAAIRAPALIVAQGASSLAKNASPLATVWIQGNSTYGTSSLAVAADAFNAGTLRLESTGSSWLSQIVIPVGAEFANEASGSIAVNVGSGGPRAFAGSGDFRNEGAMSIEAGIGLTMDGASRDFRNAGGTMDVDGVLSMTSSAFLLENGAVSGAGTVFVANGSFLLQGGSFAPTGSVVNSAIDVDASLEAPALVVAQGGCSLARNASPLATIWIQGNGTYGTSSLAVAADAFNAGTLRLESIGSSWLSQISTPADAEFVNQPSGSILVRLGSGGPRAFAGSGDVRNEGSLSIEAGIGLTMDGAGRVFRNAGGSASIDGVLSMSGPTFLLEGGAVSGAGSVFVANGSLLLDGGSFTATGSVVNSAIDIDASLDAPALVIAQGGCSLANNASPLATVWVQGNGAYGTASLTVGALAANAGTIRLESVGSSWVSQIVIPSGATFGNLVTGRIESRLGSGGPRNILGAKSVLVNHGTLDPGGPNHLFIQGHFIQSASGVFETRYGGANPPQHSRLNVQGTATLGGTIALGLVDGYTPSAGTAHVPLAAGTVVGTFANTATCDAVSIQYTPTEVRVFFSISGVYADLDGNGSVSAADLAILLGAWGTDNCLADLNFNGSVDASDLALLLGAWTG